MIISILAVGIFVRFFHLGVIPPGLNQDEASIGYDAWALLRYGIDRNGFHNPIHLVSWGSGQNALYAYLSMPFIALFGLNTFSVRILNAAMGCLSLPIFYYLIQGVTDRKTGIIALFLLAISPWHIMMSRWGLESNIFPAFLLIGTWLVFLSLKRNSFLPLAMFVFALSLYAYGTAYFFVPLFLLGILLYLLRHGKIRSITLLISIGVFVLTALPILLFLLVNIYQLDSMQLLGFSIPRLPSTPRFSTISSLLSHRFFTDSFTNFLDLLDLLFGTQSDGLIWNSIHPYGYMFHFSTPFLIFGLVRSLKREYWYRFHPALLIPIWFLAAIALGTVVSVNVNRVNAVFLPAIALIAFGMSHLYEHAKTFLKVSSSYMQSSLCFFSIPILASIPSTQVLRSLSPLEKQSNTHLPRLHHMYPSTLQIRSTCHTFSFSSTEKSVPILSLTQ